MKKMINLALCYAIAAMAGGVFYREFTKHMGFTGKTTLSVLHTHLFLLGMVMFLVVALYCAHTPLLQNKRFKGFLLTYNTGVVLTAVMLLVRGVLQVLETPLGRGADAAISGISGVGHILTGVGIILLLLVLRQIAEAKKDN